MSYINNTASHSYATENGEPNEEPDKDRPTNGLSNESTANVLRVRYDGLAIWAEFTLIDSSNMKDVVPVEVVKAIFPW
jgi:hypothetical protein